MGCPTLEYYEKTCSSFGMAMETRSFSSEAYRYGFQGQEGDHEVKGDGASWNYTYRMHDARIGRFFARDPLEASYPWNSPYAFSENRLIDSRELEGLEKVDVDIIQEPSLKVEYDSKTIWEGGWGAPVGRLIEKKGIANVVVHLQYKAICEGDFKNPNIDAGELSNRFSHGDNIFTSNVLPGEGQVINDQNGKWIINLKYDVNYLGCTSMLEGLKWAAEDQKGRGIIFAHGEDYPYTEFGIHDISYSDLGDFDNLLLGSEGGFIKSVIRPSNLHSSSYSSSTYTKSNFIIPGVSGYLLFPYYASHNFDQETGGIASLNQNVFSINLFNNIGVSNTVIAAHEMGHNMSVHHWHGNNYEYKQHGLQSNSDPRVSFENSLNILNDFNNYD